MASHLGPSQVQVTVAQADRLVNRPLVGDAERRRQRRVEHRQVLGLHLDLAGRQVWVLCALGPPRDWPFHFDDVLGAHVARRLVRVGSMLRIEDHLYQSVAVAQVQEDDAAVVAPPVYPPLQETVPALVGQPQLAAGMGTPHSKHPLVGSWYDTATVPKSMSETVSVSPADRRSQSSGAAPVGRDHSTRSVWPTAAARRNADCLRRRRGPPDSCQPGSPGALSSG